MGKGIFTYYKERLIEIGGNNKCLYLKNIVRRGAYDIGRIFEGRDNKVAEFVEFLWSKKKFPLSLIDTAEKKQILENIGVRAPLGSRVTADAAVDEAERKAALKRDRTEREAASRR